MVLWFTKRAMGWMDAPPEAEHRKDSGICLRVRNRRLRPPLGYTAFPGSTPTKHVHMRDTLSQAARGGCHNGPYGTRGIAGNPET
jgi:hypothetical protein